MEAQTSQTKYAQRQGAVHRTIPAQQDGGSANLPQRSFNHFLADWPRDVTHDQGLNHVGLLHARYFTPQHAMCACFANPYRHQ